jgi:hypothetical protein
VTHLTIHLVNSIFFTILTGFLLVSPVASVMGPAPSYNDTEFVQSRVQAGCVFLDKLYNSTLNLVREYSTSSTYWVASDNLLAQEALKSCAPKDAQSISNAISQNFAGNSSLNHGYSLMHEAALGVPINLTIYLPRRATNVTSIWPNSKGSVIRYELHDNKTDILRPSLYADVASYVGLENWGRQNQTGYRRMLQILSGMWNGTGLADEVFRHGTPGSEYHIYQTFKDALYLLLLVKTGQPVPDNLERELLLRQAQDGGFNTGYYDNGLNAGTAENAETTSLAILALQSHIPPEEWWETYWYVFLIPITIIPLLLFYLLYYRPRHSTMEGSRGPIPTSVTARLFSQSRRLFCND